MSNRCINCGDVVITDPPQPCSECLQLSTGTLQCSANGPTLGTSGTYDATALLSNSSICTSSVTWTLVEYDTDGFSSVSIDSATGVISYTVNPVGTVNEYYEIRFRAACTNASQRFSTLGSFFICAADLCYGVTCGPGQTCWPATGACVTADAVDVDEGDIANAVVEVVDVATPSTDCTAAGAATTYSIVSGSEINVTVVNNGNGTFDATPGCGDFSFQYTINCDGVVVDTATVSGYGLCATIADAADVLVTGDLTTVDTLCNSGTTTWAEEAPTNRTNITALTLNANGTYSVTPTDLSLPWSFDYVILCDAIEVDTGTLTGAAITATANDDTGTSAAAAVQVSGIAATNDVTCSQGTTAYALTGGTGNPVNGTVDTFNTSTGAWDFTPTADGDWSFQYDITCTVGVVTTVIDTATVSGTTLAAITATDDAAGDKAIGVEFVYDAAANDTNTGVTCTPITYTIVTGSQTNCTVANNGDGTFDITPGTAQGGAWSFQYKACCADGTTCDTATVSGTTPEAVSDNAGSIPTSPLTVIDVKGNDTACTGAATTYPLVTLSEVNCTVVDNANGTFDVTPTAVGAWSFQYELRCDGIVFDTATVYGLATAP